MRAIVELSAATVVAAWVMVGGIAPTEAAGRDVRVGNAGSDYGRAGLGGVTVAPRDRPRDRGGFRGGDRVGYGYGDGYGVFANGYSGFGGNGLGAEVLDRRPQPFGPVALGIREAPSLPPAVYVISAPSAVTRRAPPAAAAPSGFVSPKAQISAVR